MTDRVKDRAAIIFGGGQTPGETIGNGRATAIVLAREGAKLVIVDRDLAAAEETAAIIRGEGGHLRRHPAAEPEANERVVLQSGAAGERKHHRREVTRVARPIRARGIAEPGHIRREDGEVPRQFLVKRAPAGWANVVVEQQQAGA